MKPMVEGMGLEWNNQLRNIKEDSSLAPVMATMATTGSDGKHYDMVCLPLSYAAGTVLSSAVVFITTTDICQEQLNDACYDTC